MVEYNEDLSLEEAEKKVEENRNKKKKLSIFSQTREEVKENVGLQAEAAEDENK